MNEEREDTVARVLRAAGRRPAVDPERLRLVRETVHAEWEREVDKRRTRTAVMAIASIAIAAMVAAVLFFLRTPAPEPGLVFDGFSGEYTWQGASLRIEAGSRIRLGTNVAVLERGAVYYSSGTRRDQITIRTPYGDVRDIGTAFEVRLADGGVRVRVDQGLVELRGTTIGTGMALFATANTVEQQITLEGQTLREVVERVARMKGLSVRWETSAGDAKLHGDVPLPLDEALEAATAASGVSYRIEGDELTVMP